MVDRMSAFMDNPALFTGHPMAIRSSALSLLLFTGDPSLGAQLEEDFRKAQVTLVKDVKAASRAAARHLFDGVILEVRRDRPQDLDEIQKAIDPKHTFILAGTRGALRHAPRLAQAVARANGAVSVDSGRPFDLEEYLDRKLEHFVKGMKNGSARNLHPMLIAAIEKPLIGRVLKETNGNQVQAADLLGMNRNTLRKKIRVLKIAVTRGSSKHA